jgi:sulfane dehydrogenase subunit SoxC
MDSSSAAAEMVTLCAAAGYVVHFFPTGQGNVIGNPILPVIKLCANPRTVRTMSEHIDVDVSGLLRKELTPDQAGDKLLDCMFRTANGRLTAAEALGHREFVLTRLYESAWQFRHRGKRLSHPFFQRQRRAHLEGAFAAEEVGLALRNVSLPLEALRYDLTPVGLHYTLSHFDIPQLDPLAYRLRIEASGGQSADIPLAKLRAMPQATLRVTLECAGNGRAGFAPRYPSMPWTHGGVSTADWSGVSLHDVLRDLIPAEAKEIAFFGADRGFDSGVEHPFGRSLPLDEALKPQVLLAWQMNGRPLAPQHGAPLRLVVPGWFGMASVKWLERIAVLDRPFDGYQQVVGYRYTKQRGEPGTPVRHSKVKSLIAPPGIPDWYTGRRLVDAGRVEIQGRAWSGAGVAVTQVELAVDGEWRAAELEAPSERFAWQRWRASWTAVPGEHELACRATDAQGAVQPPEPDWNVGGMGNNAIHRVQVTVRWAARWP